MKEKRKKELTEEEIIKKEKDLGIIRAVEEEESFSSEPCPKCGSRKTSISRSFYMYADEEEVNILRCSKCGHKFRLGSGSGLISH